MNLNLLLKELKNNLKGTIITSLVVVLYTALSFLIYASMKENISKATDFYYIMPESFQVAAHINRASCLILVNRSSWAAATIRPSSTSAAALS